MLLTFKKKNVGGCAKLSGELMENFRAKKKKKKRQMWSHNGSVCDVKHSVSSPRRYFMSYFPARPPQGEHGEISPANFSFIVWWISHRWFTWWMRSISDSDAEPSAAGSSSNEILPYFYCLQLWAAVYLRCNMDPDCVWLALCITSVETYFCLVYVCHRCIHHLNTEIMIRTF